VEKAIEEKLIAERKIRDEIEENLFNEIICFYPETHTLNIKKCANKKSSPEPSELAKQICKFSN
jgi:hypothetical protein